MKKQSKKQPKRPAKRQTKTKVKKIPASKPPTKAKTTPPPTKGKSAKTALDRIADSWEAQTREMDRLIAADPENALRIARERFDYAFSLFIRLIEKKSLYEPIYLKDGTISDHYSNDYAADCLSNRLGWFMESVSRFARAGDRNMIHAAWFLALQFSETIHDIALDRPDRLEWLAKSSFFMPSLRAKQENFRYDFPKIAKDTHLSEECLFQPRIHNPPQLDRNSTRFVADILQDMASTIQRLKFHKHTHALFLEHAAKGIAEFQKYADMPLEKWLLDSCYFKPHQLHYDELPPLTKKTVPEWWNMAIAGEVERRFEKMKGTRFHAELQAGNGKDYDVKAEYKHRCKQALEGLAAPDE